MAEPYTLARRPQPKAASSVRPVITFEGARALYFGPALGLKPHRNAAFTLAVGLDAPIKLTLFATESSLSTVTEAPIVHVPAGHEHQLEARGTMVFLYLDPLSDDTRRLARSDFHKSYDVIVAEKRENLRLWALDRWRTTLGVVVSNAIDPRAASVAREMLGDPNLYPSLSDAARAVSISPTRFQAVFRQQLGAPFRRFRLWRRMGLAMTVLASGATATEAAYEAGFSSSAHFSHQFLRMFGLPPSALMALDPEIRCERRNRA
jgi:AraC-like DNA-binding protein